MSSLYFNADLHPDAFVVGARLPIWGADARHAAQVARVRTGERIGVGDGKGRLAWGRVVHVAQSEVAIKADEIVIEERTGPAIVLVQALAKGDRDELAIQAATELGVSSVVPWQATRSVSRWDGPKAAKGEERWRSVVREASKQAIRPSVPEVRPFVTTKGLLASLAPVPERGEAESKGPRNGLVLVLEPSALISLVELVSRRTAAQPSSTNEAESITLIVGPEGGIAPEELDALAAAGAQLVRLGPEILRTSTAGPAAIAALAVLLGRW